jgi:hypothetical protein
MVPIEGAAVYCETFGLNLSRAGGSTPEGLALRFHASCH